MKTKLWTLMLALAGPILMSCDMDGHHRWVDRAIEQAFRSRYPGARDVEWEFERGSYAVEFRRDGVEAEAWFDAQGGWSMTQTDLRYHRLPQAVRDAFRRSEYASWRVDDVDMFEYPDKPTRYIVEVERGHTEFELEFTAHGTLVQARPTY